jgi:hypothetical protein
MFDWLKTKNFRIVVEVEEVLYPCLCGSTDFSPIGNYKDIFKCSKCGLIYHVDAQFAKAKIDARVEEY